MSFIKNIIKSLDLNLKNDINLCLNNKVHFILIKVWTLYFMSYLTMSENPRTKNIKNGNIKI